ncbi:MAG: DUF2911 domain-containing protein [Gemmatimonadota bacterium]|nr:DUF2911 domain-containing protein [Gemmatimonadota bacterium]
MMRTTTRALFGALSLSVITSCAQSPREATPVSEAERDAAPAAAPAADTATPPGGQPLASPRDSATATVSGATVSINYGRPSMRGRTIFGGLVPYDKVWRTGANEATAFTTTRAVTIGSAAVPAGNYTLYTNLTATTTMPDCSASEDGVAGGHLIISKQTGQWGTEYSEGMDLARVPMRACRLAAPVEQFEISIVPSGSDAGTLHFSWATTRYSVPFRVSQ